jgi:hypothetical protein
MKIKMLKTKKGSTDGCTINTYLVGRDYDMPDSLANVFVNQLNVATEIEPVSKESIKHDEIGQKIEVPEKEIKIDVPEKPIEMETPMKVVSKPKRRRGRPKKVK